MKIIHCSDLHLDSPLGSNFSPEKASQRNAELRAAFARMVAFACREQVDAVLIAGDLFDSSYVSSSTAAFVAEQIRVASSVAFFYLRGNHDEAKDVFEGIKKPENLKTFGNHWESIRCKETVITAMEPEGDSWIQMYNRLRLNPEDLNIVMLHGQAATQPGAEKIALNLLKNKHIHYLALGHLHSFQKERLDSSGEYCYCGCMEGRGFDECGQKGFVLLETTGGRLESRFIPFAARTLHEIAVDISSCETATQILAAMRQEARGILPDDLVKFRLIGTYTLQTRKDIHFLLKMLEPEFWFVKIKDESRLTIDRKTYAYDLSLKGEFVRAVLASNHSEEDKERIINCGIRALSGEEVLL